jgi:HD-GYP domain-containing protein (c-di-GMP phosphodiesterase class II)
MTSDRVYRAGKPYEEAAEELEKWAGKQFDPQVVQAFHRVPRQEWEELRRRSLIKKQEKVAVHSSVAAMMDTSLTALAS